MQWAAVRLPLLDGSAAGLPRPLQMSPRSASLHSGCLAGAARPTGLPRPPLAERSSAGLHLVEGHLVLELTGSIPEMVWVVGEAVGY